MATSITVQEYRKLLNDSESTDQQIKSRLQYLEAFCRNIIQIELENYAVSKKSNGKKSK